MGVVRVNEANLWLVQRWSACCRDNFVGSFPAPAAMCLRGKKHLCGLADNQDNTSFCSCPRLFAEWPQGSLQHIRSWMKKYGTSKSRSEDLERQSVPSASPTQIDSLVISPVHCFWPESVCNLDLHPFCTSVVKTSENGESTSECLGVMPPSPENQSGDFGQRVSVSQDFRLVRPPPRPYPSET